MLNEYFNPVQCLKVFSDFYFAVERIQIRVYLIYAIAPIGTLGTTTTTTTTGTTYK